MRAIKALTCITPTVGCEKTDAGCSQLCLFIV